MLTLIHLFFTGCPDPLPPVHGYVNVSEGRTVGDKVTYSCNTGYRLVGVDSRVCRADTTWSSNDPECLIGIETL